jgi:hypothetical protein
MMATWLADVLRAAGCTVVEVDGWETRGRPAPFGPVQGVLCHDTASAIGSNTLPMILHGRPDLPGPLAHLYLAVDGSFTVVAAGHCNHAGPGEWQGVTAGNTHFIGIEAENDGLADDPWPDVQVEEYAKGVAAILDHIGAATIMCGGHKEYAPTRKIDPSFDMDRFRAKVSLARARVP